MDGTTAAAGHAATIVVERQGKHIALITIDRPLARNALSFDVWEELLAALAVLRDDADLRAVVLTGRGGYFSAGGDLKTPPARGHHATAMVARMELAHRGLTALRALQVPVIAAIEGGAAGLGWSLALACDMIVASRAAVFAASFVARGVVPDGGAGWFLARRLGRYKAAELLFEGRPLPAEEAAALGLVNRLVDAGDAVSHALNWAAKIPVAAPHAVELTKRLLNGAEHSDLASYFESELFAGALCQLGPAAQRARDGFLKSTSKNAAGDHNEDC